MNETITVYKIGMNGIWCVFDKLDDALDDIRLIILEGAADEISFVKEQMDINEYEKMEDFKGW